MSKNALIATGLLALSACGQDPAPRPPARKVAATTQPRVDRPVEDVLAKVPPEQRNAVQAALACRVKANKGPAIRITPELVREVVERLKSDPSSGKC